MTVASQQNKRSKPQTLQKDRRPIGKKVEPVKGDSGARRADLTREYQKALRDKALWNKEKLRSRLGPRDTVKRNKELQAAIDASKQRLNAFNVSEAASARRQRVMEERAAMGRELSKQGKPKAKATALPVPEMNTAPTVISNPLFEPSQSRNLVDNPLFNPHAIESRLRLLKSSHGRRQSTTSNQTLADLPALLPDIQQVPMRARKNARSLNNQIYNGFESLNLNNMQEEVEDIDHISFNLPVLPKRRARPFFYEFGATESPDNTGWNDVEQPKTIEELPMPFQGHPLFNRVYRRARRHPRVADNIPTSSEPLIPSHRKRHPVSNTQDERSSENVPFLANPAIPLWRKRRPPLTAALNLPPLSDSGTAPSLRKRRRLEFETGDSTVVLNEQLPGLRDSVNVPSMRKRHTSDFGDLPSPGRSTVPVLRQRQASEQLPGLIGSKQIPSLRKRRMLDFGDLPSPGGSTVPVLLPTLSDSGMPPSLRRRRNPGSSTQPILKTPRIKQDTYPDQALTPQTNNSRSKQTRRLDRSLASQYRNNPKSSRWTPWKKGYERLQEDKPPSKGWFSRADNVAISSRPPAINKGTPKNTRSISSSSEQTKIWAMPWKKGYQRLQEDKPPSKGWFSIGLRSNKVASPTKIPQSPAPMSKPIASDTSPRKPSSGFWAMPWSRKKESVDKPPSKGWFSPRNPASRITNSQPTTPIEMGAPKQTPQQRQTSSMDFRRFFGQSSKQQYSRHDVGSPPPPSNAFSRSRSTLRESTGQPKSASGWEAFSKNDKRSIYYGQAAKQAAREEAWQKKQAGTMHSDSILQGNVRRREALFQQGGREEQQARREALEKQRRTAEELQSQMEKEVAYERNRLREKERARQIAYEQNRLQQIRQERNRSVWQNNLKWERPHERHGGMASPYQAMKNREERARLNALKQMQAVNTSRRPQEEAEARRLNMLRQDASRRQIEMLQLEARRLKVEANLKQHQNRTQEVELGKRYVQAMVERERSRIPQKRAEIAMLDELLSKLT
jgi:hypothetical protein